MAAVLFNLVVIVLGLGALTLAIAVALARRSQRRFDAAVRAVQTTAAVPPAWAHRPLDGETRPAVPGVHHVPRRNGWMADVDDDGDLTPTSGQPLINDRVH